MSINKGESVINEKDKIIYEKTCDMLPQINNYKRLKGVKTMKQITVKLIEYNESISAFNEVYIELPKSSIGGKFYKVNSNNLAEEISKAVYDFIDENAIYL